jgi:hypothetical protein
MASNRHTLLGILLFFLAAYVLRVYGASSSIEYVPDTNAVSEAFDIGRSVLARQNYLFTANLPQHPHYPLTLPWYLVGVYGVMFGILALTGQLHSVQDFETFLFMHRAEVLFIAVLALGIMIALIVPALFVAARALNRRHYGWLAAGLGAFNLLMVHFGHQPRIHPALTTMTFVSVCVLVYVAKGARRRWVLLGTMLSGLTYGVAQFGPMIVLPLGLAWLCRAYDPETRRLCWREMFSRFGLINLLLFVVIVAVVYPWTVLEHGQFLLAPFRGTTSFTVVSNYQISTSMLSLKQLPVMIGWMWNYQPLITLLLPFAAPYLVWRLRRDWRVLLVTLPVPLLNIMYYALFLASFPRYLSMMTPFFIVAVAYLLEDAMLWLGEQLGQRRVVYAGLTALLLVPLGVTAVRFTWLIAQPDTRTLASRWVETNLADGTGLLVNYQPLEITPTQDSLDQMRTDFFGSLGRKNQWLLTRNPSEYPRPAFGIAPGWLLSPDDSPAALASRYGTTYALVAARVADSARLDAVGQYALQHGTLVASFCPGTARAELPDDLYAPVWLEVWQMHNPGRMVFILRLDRDQPQPLPLSLMDWCSARQALAATATIGSRRTEN